jgi:hypothetical protein
MCCILCCCGLGCEEIVNMICELWAADIINAWWYLTLVHYFDPKNNEVFQNVWCGHGMWCGVGAAAAMHQDIRIASDVVPMHCAIQLGLLVLLVLVHRVCSSTSIFCITVCRSTVPGIGKATVMHCSKVLMRHCKVPIFAICVWWVRQMQMTSLPGVQYKYCTYYLNYVHSSNFCQYLLQ